MLAVYQAAGVARVTTRPSLELLVSSQIVAHQDLGVYLWEVSNQDHFQEPKVP